MSMYVVQKAIAQSYALTAANEDSIAWDFADSNSMRNAQCFRCGQRRAS